MINNNTIKYWFRNQLNDAGFDTSSDFAFQNRNFDSSNMDLFYQERFVVADEGPDGNKANIKSGIMWYDVIVDRASGTDTMDNSAAALASVFEPEDNKEVEIEPGLRINIDAATTGSPEDFEESRYMEPVRIEFRAYEITA